MILDRFLKPFSRRRKCAEKTLWSLISEVARPKPKVLISGLLLILVNRVSLLIAPYFTKNLIDEVIGNKRFNLLGPLVMVMICSTLVQVLTAYSLNLFMSQSMHRLIANLRCKIQEHVECLPLTFFEANSTGALMTRIMQDPEGIRNLVGTSLIELVGGGVVFILAILIMFHLSPMITLVILCYVVVFVFLVRKSLTRVRGLNRHQAMMNAQVNGRLAESISGIRIVKGYQAEGREASVFAAGVRRQLTNAMEILTATSRLSLCSSILLGSATAIVMYFGVNQIIAGRMSIGGLFTYTILLGLLGGPIQLVISVGSQITEAIAGLERVRETLMAVPEGADPNRSLKIPRIRGNVCFENVSFSYHNGRQILHRVNFTAKPGTITALVGPSGSGKSTIIGLIGSFYKPTGGTIWVDGVDLSTVHLDSYRTQLGVVLQETFLFDGTIRENVAFSRPDATDDEVLEACRIARVDEFAETFEQKYETVVGERGVKLSGGQRQRVSIARAVLANPRILILDEATSSLDSESEALIQEALSELMKGRTTFVIAHRLSTIRHADQILVIENGRIVEQGIHESLHGTGGRYWEMYVRQHGGTDDLGSPHRVGKPGRSDLNDVYCIHG